MCECVCVWIWVIQFVVVKKQEKISVKWRRKIQLIRKKIHKFSFDVKYWFAFYGVLHKPQEYSR